MEQITEKERLNRTLKFMPVDRTPLFEIALWEQTVERWLSEGLPENAASSDLFTGSPYFGLEGYELALFNMTFPEPCPKEVKIKEDDRYETYIDGMGRTRLALKEGFVRGMRISMDCYVDHPVKTRDDFTALKKKYEKNAEKRLPENWDNLAASINASARPSTFLDRYFGSFGFYSMLRDWLGTEGLSLMFYDDPALIEEMLEFLSDFIEKVLDKPLTDAAFDLYYIHEDLSGKTGPLFSPETFARFFAGPYRRFVDFLKRKKVANVIVDTDGNFEALIPSFLDAGVEGFGPIERAAGMDPVKLREKYGNSFFMIGGIDKRVLSKEKSDILREIESVLPPLIHKGGFIPTVDHSVPPDVSLSNFIYYLEQKKRIIEGKM